ncbi:hypothetical protein GETHLI_30440 [Geothrix limicola]|uniref:Uncharacterized protein n=1 Tax=Geothrix limicola TaxID=2927978 RepID=A0ABQ5QI47_9BACT|nr:hypothetical protein [Geothrix limicola]GLH74542.1 hypothetical protein GETHLI_30440 [Geothrix limicola]
MALYLIPLTCLIIGYNLWQVFTEDVVAAPFTQSSPEPGLRSPQTESGLAEG